MAISWGASSTGKSISQPIAASDGLLTVFSGTAATPPSFVVLHMGYIPDTADVFGTATFAERLSIQDASNNETYRLRCAPTAGTFGFRIQNTAGTARAADVTITNGGTNLNGLRGCRYLAALVFDTSTRIPTGYVVHNAGGTRTTDSTASTAITAGVGLRLADECLFGVVANRFFPGIQCLTAVLSGTLTQANLEAIWDANDPGWVLHTYRTSILWATEYGLLADTIGATIPLTGQSVAADSLIVYNSGTQTSWYGVAPSAPTVTGSLSYVSPEDGGFAVNKSIVPDGGEDITTEVQHAAINPAANTIGLAYAGTAPTKATHIVVTSNSRGCRTNTDPQNRQTQNDSYHSSQPASIDANWSGGFAARFPEYVVGHFRVPKVTGAGFGGTLSAWSGTLPSTGTVTLKSGTGTNSADVDFSRLSVGSENSSGAGPGQYVAISASGGIDFLFSNCGGIGPTTPIRVWAQVMEYPNSASVTTQKVSHASSSSTVPFGDAATNWASGTTHGAESSAIVLDNQYANSTVVSYSHPTLTVFADPGARAGEVVVVNRAGTPCIGFVNDPSASPALGMEFTMGAGTGIPNASDVVYFGEHVTYRWVYVDFDGSETPTPWRGIRLRAGASGFPVNVVRVGVQALTAAGAPAPGLITWPVGWGGHGYTEQFNAMPQIPDADDGLYVLERWFQSLREPMEWGGGTQQKLALVVPAQQGSTASSSSAFTDAFIGAGWTTREVGFAADIPNAANTSTFATQAFQDFAAYGNTLGPASGIVAVCPFDDMGVPFTEMCFGWIADIAHKSTQGCYQWADQVSRIFAPVSAGGGGAALPADSGGGLGSRARIGRGRPSR